MSFGNNAIELRVMKTQRDDGQIVGQRIQCRTRNFVVLPGWYPVADWGPWQDLVAEATEDMSGAVIADGTPPPSDYPTGLVYYVRASQRALFSEEMDLDGTELALDGELMEVS